MEDVSSLLTKVLAVGCGILIFTPCVMTGTGEDPYYSIVFTSFGGVTVLVFLAVYFIMSFRRQFIISDIIGVIASGIGYFALIDKMGQFKDRVAIYGVDPENVYYMGAGYILFGMFGLFAFFSLVDIFIRVSNN